MNPAFHLALACALVAAPALAPLSAAHVEVGFDGNGDWHCTASETWSIPVPHTGVGPDPHRFSQCYVLA